MGVITLYSGLSICYLLNIAGFANQVDSYGFTQSALNPLVFVIIGYFLRYTYIDLKGIEDKRRQKRRFAFSYAFSFLLALSFIMGYQMRNIGNTLPGFKGKGFILLMSGGVAFAFLPIMNSWFKLLGNVKSSSNIKSLSKKTQSRSFWFSWIIIFLSWIPVFMAYYPAIMSYDFHRQSQEAYKGYIWFNSHHPLAHTFLIRVFFLLGEAIGSYQISMAIFSILQMLVLSVIMAYSCNVIYRMTHRIWPVTFTVIIFALLPIHPILGMSITKDILYSAFFLLFILLIWEQRRFFTKIYSGTTQDRWKMFCFAIALIAVGILCILFRNNAIYALVPFTIFFILTSRKQRLYIAILCIAIVAGGLGCKKGIHTAMECGTGSKIEMYSVFMQQFARTGLRQNEQLTDEERKIIDYYIPEESWDVYNATIADGVKAHSGTCFEKEWQYHVVSMFSDWIKIGMRYPNEYIDAFLALTSGYWFLDDVSHAEVLTYGEDTNFGLLYTFNASFSDSFHGIESKSFLPGLLSIYQKVVNGNCYYSWPILSILFKPAFYCWLLLLVLFSHCYMKEPQKVFMSVLVILYFFTLLLGPVAIMRYAYPIIVTVPVLITHVFYNEA